MGWKNVGENLETSCHCAQQCNERFNSLTVQSLSVLMLPFWGHVSPTFLPILLYQVKLIKWQPKKISFSTQRLYRLARWFLMVTVLSVGSIKIGISGSLATVGSEDLWTFPWRSPFSFLQSKKWGFVWCNRKSWGVVWLRHSPILGTDVIGFLSVCLLSLLCSAAPPPP